MTIIITGGSGFIGRHLARRLSETEDLVIMDKAKPSFPANFIQCDLSKECKPGSDTDALFHFAASPDVRKSMETPSESMENNVVATHNILEACRKHDIKKIIFASTSAVYGNAEIIPTPETAELKPVSIYGATKAACEAFIRAYHEAYGLDAVILRYANIYGPGSNHGVMHDFVRKLQADKSRLEILGNGAQSKSYLYIDDAIDATLMASQMKGWHVFNVGSEKQTTVEEIAQIVAEALGIGNVQLSFTGGEGGWAGDVPKFLLDVTKIKAHGWRETTGIKTGAKNYVQWLVDKHE